MTSAQIETLVDGGIGFLTLARPEARNALNPAMINAMDAAVKLWDDDPQVKVILLSAQGTSFCAGLDMKAGWPMQLADMIRSGIAARLSLQRSRKPVIAAVSGAAFGAGAELMLAADMVLVDEDFQFSLPEFTLGALPVTGAMARLSALVGPMRLAELLATGRWVGAAEAVDLRIALSAHPLTSLLSEAQSLAQAIAKQPVEQALLFKQALRSVRGEIPAGDEEAMLAMAALSITMARPRS